MPENTTQPIPQSAPSAVVVPPSEPPKKGPGVVWLVVVLAVAVMGGSAYFLYTQLQKPQEEVSLARPGVTTGQTKPNQGFGTQPTVAPTATPTITSSDSVVDIEKDLTGTTIQSGNASEFDADLQSL